MTDDKLECPSPGDCDFSTDDQEEFTEHLNEEHAGEYQHPKWPDNEVGCAARTRNQEDDEEDGGDAEE